MTGKVGTTGARSGIVGVISKEAMSGGGTGAANIPAGTTAERPSAPEIGYTRMNTTSGTIEFWDGAQWLGTNLIPELSSISGFITDGTSMTAVFLADDKFQLAITIANATDKVDIIYTDSSDAAITTVAEQNVTGGVCTTVIPSQVYGKDVDDVITISCKNSDGTPSSNSLDETVVAAWTGGTISTSGDYRVHTFLTTANFIVPAGMATGFTYNYLVVASGGGGGSRHSGGGGGGGVISVTGSTAIPAGTYSMSVGAATGRSIGEMQPGILGSNSTAFGETAVRGGAAGPYAPSGCIAANYNGGSGCGASDRQCNVGIGWDSKGAGNSTQGGAVQSYGGSANHYGNRGGTTNYSHTGGGGGGAGAQGTGGSQTQAGHGGVGIQINFDGNNWYWAGGGGGNRWGDQTSIYGGTGGSGGGGGGGAQYPEGAAGPGPGGGTARNAAQAGGGPGHVENGGDAGVNTGGGGGGGTGNQNYVGGSGAAGIIQVKYKPA